MVQALLGVDIGTTACKALVLEASGHVIAVAERPTPWVEVETGGEIQADILEETVITAIADALSQAPKATVPAVGVTGMGETGFLIDRDGQALTPGIAWHDRRGLDEAEAIAGRLGRGRFQERTGLPLGPSWTIAKIRSLLDREPPPPGTMWLSIAEWAAHRLGGEAAAEPSLASRTGFLDVLAGCWWAEAAEAVGLRPEHLPRLVPAGTATGSVSRLPGLAGAVVTVAGHDQPVSAIGAGAFAPAEVHVSCGTAEAVLQSLLRPLEASITSAAAALGLTAGCHALTDRYALMGFITSGLTLRSLLRKLDIAEAGVDRERLDSSAKQALERTGASPDGLQQSDLAAGIDTATSPETIWIAALDASAREGASLLRRVETVGGPAARVVLSGGWTRSDLFLAIRRRFVPSFDHVLVAETAARGAALLAGMAAGVYADHRDFPPPALSES